MMYEFTLNQLLLIQKSVASVFAVAVNDDNAPAMVVEELVNALGKLNEILDNRSKENTEFISIVNKSLNELDKYGEQIIKETENKK